MARSPTLNPVIHVKFQGFHNACNESRHDFYIFACIFLMLVGHIYTHTHTHSQEISNSCQLAKGIFIACIQTLKVSIDDHINICLYDIIHLFFLISTLATLREKSNNTITSTLCSFCQGLDKRCPITPVAD